MVTHQKAGFWRRLGFDGVTVLWPQGTKIVTDDPLTIQVPGLGRVTSGDSAYGRVDTFAPGHLPEGIGAIPDGCPSELIAFFPEGERPLIGYL
ncbi:MAG TPA: hypothetical protein VFM08_11335 [Nocardioides sp.]|nr:hypothetical protein [Nocardioides sp.]